MFGFKIVKEKFIILFAVFVDIVGLGVVIPILPFYAESFGATPKVVTLLFSVFALCSFFSAPVLGSISDRFGRRPVFISSLLSTSAGWFIFAAAGSLPVLFLGRIIDGLAAGNITTAQSYLVDISKSDKERAANIGLIGAVMGIGFVVGPLVGGLLGTISKTFPFWFTGFLALANAAVAFFFLPESNLSPKKDGKTSFNPFRPIARAGKNQILRPYFSAWFLFLVSVSSLQSIFALYINSVFGMGAFFAGLFMGLMGAVIAFNQAVVLRRFWLKKFVERNLILGGLAACFFGFLIISWRVVPALVFGLILHSFSQSLLRVVMISEITGKAPDGSRGEIIGITASITSISMIVGPLIAGWAFEISRILPFYFSAACVFASFFIIYSALYSYGKKEYIFD